MYQGINSKISMNDGSTAFFDCKIEVRQGKNRSPILFTLYLNDLEQGIGIECDVLTDDTYIC